MKCFRGGRRGVLWPTCGDHGEEARLGLHAELVDAPAEEAAVVHLRDGDVLRHGVSLVGEDGVRGDVPELCAGVELPSWDKLNYK